MNYISSVLYLVVHSGPLEADSCIVMTESIIYLAQNVFPWDINVTEYISRGEGQVACIGKVFMILCHLLLSQHTNAF